MQFVYHIRKYIDIVGLIWHLFGSQIGAVIIPSQVAHYQGDIYRDLALNYTGTQFEVLLLLLESETSQYPWQQSYIWWLHSMLQGMHGLVSVTSLTAHSLSHVGSHHSKSQ